LWATFHAVTNKYGERGLTPQSGKFPKKDAWNSEFSLIPSDRSGRRDVNPTAASPVWRVVIAVATVIFDDGTMIGNAFSAKNHIESKIEFDVSPENPIEFDTWARDDGRNRTGFPGRSIVHADL